ncbi:hypothetical protein PSTT_14152, partial [Puccinia striiformis]
PFIKQSPGSNMSALPCSISTLATRHSKVGQPLQFTLKPLVNPQTSPPPPEPHNRSKSAPPNLTLSKPREGTNSPSPAEQPVSHFYNLSFPEPQQSFIDSPDRMMNPSPTPRTAEPIMKSQALSLSDFCDQLSAEVHDQSFEVASVHCSRNSKKKTSNRKTKKGGPRRPPMCPQTSDSEDVLTFDHSIFSSHESPSRSATPTPTKISESPAILNAAPSPPPNYHNRLLHYLAVNTLWPPFSISRNHPMDPKLRNGKGDWDMPSVAHAQGLTWQQMPKKADKNVSSATAPKLTHHDLKASSLAPESPIHNSKEAPTRRHRTALARTSSATTLSRLPASAAKSIPSSSSRSDDESAMTWQQSILRPSPRHPLVTSRSEQLVNSSEIKSYSKKNAAPTGTKTPMKGSCITRKPGVSSTIKPRTNGPVPSPNKRRNSLSSSRDPPAKPMENTPIHEKSQSLGLKSGENVFSDWKSLTCPAEQKLTQPIFSLPLPILGAQADFNTPTRRHVKSYTHQPDGFPHSSGSSQPNNSAPVHSHIPDLKALKAVTPSKPRSTSEDLYLAHPGNKLSSPALRAATFMYAGPQFHNSPCPAALPPPKFAFGSA